MWVYLKQRQGNGDYLYTVGFFEPNADPDCKAAFYGDEDFADVNDARARVNYLNGGYVER